MRLPVSLALAEVRRAAGGSAGGGESPATTVKLSRVGFDAGRTEAVAFIAVRARGTSSGEYVRLTRASSGEWRVSDRLRFP